MSSHGASVCCWKVIASKQFSMYVCMYVCMYLLFVIICMLNEGKCSSLSGFPLHGLNPVPLGPRSTKYISNENPSSIV